MKNKYFIEIFDRKLLLFTVDTVIIFLILWWYVSFLRPTLTLQELLFYYPDWFISCIVLWTVFAYTVNLYSLEVISIPMPSLKNTFLASVFTVFSYLFLPIFTPPFPDSRFVIFQFIFIFTLCLQTWRYVYARISVQSPFIKRLLVIGAGWPGKAIVDIFVTEEVFKFHLGYQVVGFVDDREEFQNSTYKGIKVISNSYDLLKIVKRLKINEIIVDTSLDINLKGEMLGKLVDCRKLGVAITSLTDFYEMMTGRVPVQHVGNNFYLAFPYNRNNYKKGYLLFARLVDIFFGLVGSLLCLILTPVIILLNLSLSPGPLFYTQERVGLYGRIFKLVKFRSMVVDAEKTTGAAWAQQNDSRVTPAGKFMRKSRIDELPQSWSVLKGDMSLIGPRPERPIFVDQLKAEIPFYDTRHLVKPGLTGWAQVLYKYGSNKEDMLTKIQYDMYYIKYRSILMDLKIILKTISVVVRFKGF